MTINQLQIENYKSFISLCFTMTTWSTSSQNIANLVKLNSSRECLYYSHVQVADSSHEYFKSSRVMRWWLGRRSIRFGAKSSRECKPKWLAGLGVTVSNHLSVSEHVSSVISRCAQRIHALRILRSQRLCNEAIHRVYKSVIIGKLLYAVSAWWGFSSAADRQRLQTLLHRGIRSGLCSPETPTHRTGRIHWWHTFPTHHAQPIPCYTPLAFTPLLYTTNFLTLLDKGIMIDN